MADLPPDMPGGAIVYCATRRQTEEVAEFLQDKEIAADYFHAGLPPETKKECAAVLHQRRTARDRSHQCLRHGHRQTGCAAGNPRRHPWVAGELFAGGGTRRTRSTDGTLRTTLCDGRCGETVRHVGAFAAHPARDSRRPESTAQPWTGRSGWTARSWPPLARSSVKTTKRRSKGTPSPTTPACEPPYPGSRRRYC